MKRKLLLISNSTNFGEAYLGWTLPIIEDFIKKHELKKLIFVPYAGVSMSYDVYYDKVNEVFRNFGVELGSVHLEAEPAKAIDEVDGVVVGGGNTFHLVYMLHQTGLMQKIREKVLDGMPFMGWSAGANIACPSLKTTNDMPIIEPQSFNCLELVPFQINPHYIDVNPVGHGGETRQQRIEEFLCVNRHIKVVGLREATALLIHDNTCKLLGTRNMMLFEHQQPARELNVGDDLSFLL
ncbi:MAG: dipeptidase PepE [Bacteroidota bacterium]